MNILLLEPDKVLARAYRAALVAAGYHVVVAASAQAAVHAADERKPDLVIVELQLPQHNGVEFLYEFRSYSEWLEVPVMIHSFVAPNRLAEAPTLKRELGVGQVLYKPSTSLAQLVSAVGHMAAA